jgi:sugar lactone lactonase YvrE
VCPQVQAGSTTFDGSVLCGRRGTAAGRLDMARGLAFAPGGEIVVADHRNHRVSVFGPDGRPHRTFGHMGSGPGQFVLPQAVMVDARGHILVADTDNARLQEFTSAGELLAVWPMSSEVSFPRALTAAPNGVIFVLTSDAVGEAGRLERYSPAGEALGGWDLAGRSHNALAVDGRGVLYVGGRDDDHGVAIVLRFDPEGRNLGLRWVPECGERVLGIAPSADGTLLLSGPARFVTCTFEGPASKVEVPYVGDFDQDLAFTCGAVRDARGVLYAAIDRGVVRFKAVPPAAPAIIAALR